MKAVLPGKPEPRLQALTTGLWDSRRIVVYISGNSLAILTDHDTLLQTIYDDDETPLEAVSFDEVSGKIAVCTNQNIRIYQPFGREENALKWALQTSFPTDISLAQDGEGCSKALGLCLSWGGSEELLVGYSSLALYQTTTSPTCVWRKTVPSKVKYALLSYDSAYIASVGYHDRLVKVWRRLTFGSDDVRFDFIYLPHPQAVSSLQWRKPYHVDQTVDNVLFTFSVDNVLRIWTGSDIHGSPLPQLWGTVDLTATLQNQALGNRGPHTVQWATILHGRDFAAATEKAVQDEVPGSEKDDAALQHIISVANRNPEICIVFDGRGHMSAWAMENITSKPQSPHHIFTVAHIDADELNFYNILDCDPSQHIEVYPYSTASGGFLDLLVHSFDGRIALFESNIARFFDPNPQSKRIALKAIWSGHSSPIRKMVRNFSGRAVVSRTQDGESIVWAHALGATDTRLSRKNLIPEMGHIHRICVLRKGRFVVFLFHDRIAVWDCRQSKPSLLTSCSYSVSGKPLCLLNLPRQRAEDSSVAHIATITSQKKGVVWQLDLPIYAPRTTQPLVNGHRKASIREFCRFELDDAGDLAYVLPVDPAGSSPVISGFLDVFARDVAISYTHSGRVEFWTARVSPGRVEWLSTSSMETAVANPALVSGSTMKKAALVNSSRSNLTIWDIRGARLEYAQDFESHNIIQDLDWTSTPDSQSILAVGFPSRVLLLSEMRFDYLNKGPAWAPVREISIRDYTPHSIGDSTWLGDGHLVIGTGNQLYVHDRRFDVSSSLVTSLRLPHRKDGMWDLFDVVQRLNGPLPVFHPQFLSQFMLAGKISLVHRILKSLHRTLKFWVQGDEIDDYLGLDMEEFYTSTNWTDAPAVERESDSYFSRRTSSDDADDPFSEDVAQAICEKLTRVALPQLSGHEQIQLVDIIECVGLVETQRRSIDENGARFMLFFRQHALRKGRTNEIHMSWREISWAYHSTSQDILVDFVSRQHHGRLLWESARESGVFMWLTDNAAVVAQFEIIARNEYTRSEVKNPVDCSLFYLALRKKTVLQGLWRMASWNREQGATLKLLANNFDDPRWRTTALKNAYALLSKRRFSYAAAFFLLADRLQDAVNVCLNQLKDLQLAIAIARVYEGDQGPVLKKLLEDEVLAIATQEGNRWLASWAFWMLRRRDMAVRALIVSIKLPPTSDHANNEIPDPPSPDLKSRSFLTDDPALVVLYSQLRQKTLQTLRGASKVTPKVEWEFVLHNARLYDRMGCDLLGLDLVRNWEFLRPGPTMMPGFGGDIDPLKLLKRRSSLVVADLPVHSPAPKTPSGTKMLGRQPPPPSVFEEPDSSSLLDSFGF